jgi:hypothetical protein
MGEDRRSPYIVLCVGKVNENTSKREERTIYVVAPKKPSRGKLRRRY